MSFSAAKTTFLVVFLKPPATNKEEEEKQSHFAAWTEHYPFAHPTQKEENIYIYTFQWISGQKKFWPFYLNSLYQLRIPLFKVHSFIQRKQHMPMQTQLACP